MSTLEEEIKQTRFQSNKQKALLNIVFTANWFRSTQIRMFKQYGVSPEQYNVLRILRGQKGNAIGVIGIQDRMLDKNSNASRLIDKLIEKKLVSRKSCASDRRQVDVFITESGLELLKTIDPIIQSNENNNIQLTEQEADQLNTLLNKIRTTNN